MASLTINLETVKYLVGQTFNLKTVPMNETFGNMNVHSSKLAELRNSLDPTFGKTCIVLLSDTVYSLTDKLQNK